MKSLETTSRPETRLSRNQQGGVIASLINLVFGFILAVVALRIVFLLLGANPANGLVSAVYNLSGPFVAPFAGMFGTVESGLAAARLDLAAIIALIVYGIIAALVNGVVGYSHRRVIT